MIELVESERVSSGKDLYAVFQDLLKEGDAPRPFGGPTPGSFEGRLNALQRRLEGRRLGGRFGGHEARRRQGVGKTSIGRLLRKTYSETVSYGHVFFTFHRETIPPIWIAMDEKLANPHSA